VVATTACALATCGVTELSPRDGELMLKNSLRRGRIQCLDQRTNKCTSPVATTPPSCMSARHGSGTHYMFTVGGRCLRSDQRLCNLVSACSHFETANWLPGLQLSVMSIVTAFTGVLLVLAFNYKVMLMPSLTRCQVCSSTCTLVHASSPHNYTHLLQRKRAS
jgi:hypothetical protein